jgi:hypothetical protein
VTSKGAKLRGKSSSVCSLTSKLSPQVSFNKLVPQRFQIYKSVFMPDTTAMNGCMTFERVCVDKAVLKSGILHNILTEFTIEGTGNMTDCPPDVAQVDFANK